MIFPETPRVRYDRNPLEEVICELRFPRILKIATSPPADFQERIRRDYPMLKEIQPAETIPQGLRSVLGGLGMALPDAGAKAYRFSSTDDEWSVSLKQDAVALTNNSYRRWTDFRVRLQAILAHVIEIYEPPLFTRIGLRYRDVIKRSKLGLNGVAWAELLKAHVAGELATPGVRERVEETLRQVVIKLERTGALVRIQHGLAVDNETKEDCYLIDSDFFTEVKTEPSHVLEILDDFNTHAAQLFRWCIAERLHDALGPQPMA